MDTSHHASANLKFGCIVECAFGASLLYAWDYQFSNAFVLRVYCIFDSFLNNEVFEHALSLHVFVFGNHMFSKVHFLGTGQLQIFCMFPYFRPLSTQPGPPDTITGVP